MSRSPTPRYRPRRRPELGRLGPPGSGPAPSAPGAGRARHPLPPDPPDQRPDRTDHGPDHHLARPHRRSRRRREMGCLMTQDEQTATGGTGPRPPQRVDDARRKGTYLVTNVRGGVSVGGGGGVDRLHPVELFLTAMAACSATDVDFITSRIAEPVQFDDGSEGEKMRDGVENHLTDIEVNVPVVRLILVPCGRRRSICEDGRGCGRRGWSLPAANPPVTCRVPRCRYSWWIGSACWPGLYGAGEFAYGRRGGYGRAGLHSVLEPAAWGAPGELRPALARGPGRGPAAHGGGRAAPPADPERAAAQLAAGRLDMSRMAPRESQRGGVQLAVGGVPGWSCPALGR